MAQPRESCSNNYLLKGQTDNFIDKLIQISLNIRVGECKRQRKVNDRETQSRKKN